MRRAPKLVELSRRDFCAFAAGCAGLAIAGCTDGGINAIQTGPLGGSPDGGKPPDDAHPPDDGQTSDGMPDGPPAATCSTGATDLGAAGQFAMNTPVYFGSPVRFFVVRDSGGLYALTANCTHEGVQMNVNNNTNFKCPRHGALFTFTGAIISGPVTKTLKHYSLCKLANGNVGMTTTVVSSTDRLVI
jgi:nitrite reductase/ring-hydroxylating ferredoxin subunit